MSSTYVCTVAGYKVWKGQVFDDKDLDSLYQGLKANDLHHYDYVLTGNSEVTPTLKNIPFALGIYTVVWLILFGIYLMIFPGIHIFVGLLFTLHCILNIVL